MVAKKLCLILLILMLLFAHAGAQAVEEHQELCIHVFMRENCSQCERTLPLLDQLEQDYNVTIKKYDVTNETSKELYGKFKELYGIEYVGFPAAFIGDRYLVGDRAITENLEDEVKRCLKEGCLCPLGKIRGITPYLPKPGEITPEEERKIPISILGFEAEMGAGTHILLLGVILGIVDGMNPCVIAVFLYLMGVLFGAGERKRILQIGFAFLATFFIIYFFYMLGLINIFNIIFFLREVKFIVAVFILAAGLIMVKDFFWLGRWFSLKIPDSAKPTISKLAKRATLPSAVFLAAFSTLVGLPCTTGLVLSYITTMAEIGAGSASTFYLLWYNLFRTAPLLVLIALIYWANLKVERAERWRLKTRKYMRLISGVIMLALGISLLLGWM
jgi:cytochrome c biogenesis protein CcdA/thiol-disulfide isomerase/thioredoxin